MSRIITSCVPNSNENGGFHEIYNERREIHDLRETYKIIAIIYDRRTNGKFNNARAVHAWSCMHSFFDSVLDVMDDVDIRYLFNFLFHPATVHVYRVLKKKEIKLYSWNVRKDNASRQKYSLSVSLFLR